MGILEILSEQAIANTLILIGFASLVASLLKKESTKAYLVISLACFSLSALGFYYGGIISLPHLTLFSLGGLFLVLEALVPGFGAFGLLGLGALILGFYLPAGHTYSKLISLSLGLMFSLLGGISLIKKGLKHKTLKKIILEDAIDEMTNDLSFLQGRTGLSLTVMRPSGLVEIDGKKYDALSETKFIGKDEKILVVKTEGKKIFVEKIK